MLTQTKNPPIDLAQYAYEQLREAILTGAIDPGAQLKEQTLATQLGVSRTPVREALRRLAADGFAETSPRLGVFVRRLDAESLTYLREVRCGVETTAVVLLAQRAGAATIAELLEMAKPLDEVHKVRDLDVLFGMEIAFHRKVIESAGNPELVRAASNLQAIFFTFTDSLERAKAMDPPDIDSRKWVPHQAIVEAIASRDTGRAYHAMWEHIARKPM